MSKAQASADNAGRISRTECLSYDEYTGPLKTLIAAGLLTAEQVPPRGVLTASYIDGIRQTRRCRIDEHYRRVLCNRDGSITVQVGLSATDAAPRRAAAAAANLARKAEWRAKFDAEQAQKESAKREREVLDAKVMLTDMPASSKQFLCDLAQSLRQAVARVVEDACKPPRWHGYTLTTESADPIIAATDALVGAVIDAETRFDELVHAKVANGYRATIRAADARFAHHFQTLTTLDPSILEGETS